MVVQNVFHRASSHQIVNLWRFADRCNIPWNLPTNFHSDLIATTRQRCLLSLCALLFQQSHLFPIFVVSTCNDSKELSVLVTSGFLSGSKNFCKLLCFLRSFRFTRIRLDPLSGQVLHHDCISVIVSRFTVVTEDLVICWYQEVRLRHCVFCTGPL